MREEPALAGHPPAVAGQPAIRPDDPVARHDDRDGIPGVRAGHGPDGGGSADRVRQLGVRDGAPRGNLPQARPDAFLERRSRCVHADVLERRVISREVTTQRATRLSSVRVRPDIESAEAALHLAKQDGPVVLEAESADGLASARKDDDPRRRGDLRDLQAYGLHAREAHGLIVAQVRRRRSVAGAG